MTTLKLCTRSNHDSEGNSNGEGVLLHSCSIIVTKEAAHLPFFFTNWDCMIVPICWGPRSGRLISSHQTVEADSEAGNLPVLIVELLGLVIRNGLLVMVSSSRPVVTGAAYRPELAGGASLIQRSSSCSGVADVAYHPEFTGRASPLLPAEDCKTRVVVGGVALADMAIWLSSLSNTVVGA